MPPFNDAGAFAADRYLSLRLVFFTLLQLWNIYYSFIFADAVGEETSSFWGIGAEIYGGFMKEHVTIRLSPLFLKNTLNIDWELGIGLIGSP